MSSKSYFRTVDITEEREERFKSIFDTTMDPREWMAHNGHRFIAGDPRRFKFRDLILEAWIHKAFSALVDEGIEKLWYEFLTPDEIERVSDIYHNP